MVCSRRHLLASALYKKLEECSDISDITMYLQAGADPNLIIPEYGIASFHFVIGSNVDPYGIEITKLILKYGGNPNIRSVEGLTPVHVAAAWGKVSLLYLLLVNGGDPWLLDEDRNNAFHYALQERHWDVLQLLHRFRLTDKNSDDSVKYTITLNKIILTRGDTCLEYGTTPEPLGNTSSVERDISSTIGVKEYYGEPNYTILCEDKHLTNIIYSERFTYENNTDDTNTLFKDMHFEDKSKNLSQNSKDPMTMQDAASLNGCTAICSPSNLLSELESVLHLKEKGRFSLKTALTLSSARISSVENISQSRDQLFNSAVTNLPIHDVTLNKNTSTCLKTEENLYINKYAGVDQNKISFFQTEVTKEQEILDNQNPTDQDQMFFFPELSNEITSVCKSREIGNKVNNSDITNDAVQVTSDKNLVVYSGCKTNTKNNQSDDIWVDSLHVPSSDVRQTQSNLYNGDIEETHNVTPSLLAVEDTLLTCSKYESLSKEYLYLDEEKGVALLERSLPVKSVSEHQEACLSAGHHSNDSLSSITSSVPASFVYDSDVLYEELERRGLNPGPITHTTKKVYLRKLYHHQKHDTVAPTIANTTREYSWELEQTLRSLAWQTEILSYSHLEQTVVSQFSDPALGRRWRQGIQRTSFTYLLLDSSVTCNLPERRAKLPQSQVWAIFLASIFYVGKGKRARPFAHLYQAANIWGQATTKADKKVKRILKIWNCGLGVVCLHIFQNIIPAEAFTREAAMLDALGLANLCNTRGGEYYGVAATWSARQKKQLGIYFLYRAMMVFLNEGERQLRPTDICTP